MSPLQAASHGEGYAKIKIRRGEPKVYYCSIDLEGEPRSGHFLLLKSPLKREGRCSKKVKTAPFAHLPRTGKNRKECVAPRAFTAPPATRQMLIVGGPDFSRLPHVCLSTSRERWRG